ncbi:type II secretion system protein [Candidatus Peregrinibacteria bacterium]|nr:type II secretion system protein [Candidatus Peregrinibacteria bacterium]
MLNLNTKCRKVLLRAFTLPEVMIAVFIFSMVTTIVANLYIQSFKETRRSNLENQIYEDARFVMQQIAGEIQNGMIDYDEYYNQNVIGANFGQNFGRYYSSFFNPGTDEKLGFDCNDGVLRNKHDCTPLRKTIDKITGINPFTGKADGREEDAFCGAVSYSTAVAGAYKGMCKGDGSAPDESYRKVDQLYLISANGRQKTILAREGISATAHALSILRLDGYDTNKDGIVDSFVCAAGFQCRGNDMVSDVTAIPVSDDKCGAVAPATLNAQLPRRDGAAVAPTGIYTDLNFPDGCDENDGFSKDFVPISPLRVDVSKLEFYISPTEDPHYAFAEENNLEQPRVTIVFTIGPNMAKLTAADTLAPITLVQTVSSRVLNPIQAPLLVQ